MKESGSRREEARELFAKAMRYALEGRASHAAWLEHIEAGCSCCTSGAIEVAGGADVQRAWIEKYDTIIEALTVNGAPFVLEAIAKISDDYAHERWRRMVHHALRYRRASP